MKITENGPVVTTKIGLNEFIMGKKSGLITTE